MTPRIPLPPELAQTAFTLNVGHSAGLSTKRLLGRDLQRPYRGVRSSQTTPLELFELARAYQKRMPEHAFFCGVTAAMLMNVPLPWRHENSRVLHVAVPASKRCPVAAGVIGHTILADDAGWMLWRGLRLSTPERTWFDLGRVLSVPDLAAVTDFLIHRRSQLTNRERLRAALRRYSGRRGLRALRQALDLADDRAESPQESRTRVILVGAQLGRLVVNLPITTSGGYRYRADLAFPDERVLIEYQGDYHRNPAQFRTDMTRGARLEADGWYVILINIDDLRNPEELVARIRSVLAQRRHP